LRRLEEKERGNFAVSPGGKGRKGKGGGREKKLSPFREEGERGEDKEVSFYISSKEGGRVNIEGKKEKEKRRQFPNEYVVPFA